MYAAVGARRSRAPPFIDPPGYARHRPEATLLYRLIEQHYPAFRELRVGMDRPLPAYVEEEFDAYLKCGRLEEGFQRLRCRTKQSVAGGSDTRASRGRSVERPELIG